MEATRSHSTEISDLVRNPHLWIIASLMALLTTTYYGDQIGLSQWEPFGNELRPALWKGKMIS